MKNESIEKYISELSPELQEKAKACQTKEELLALAAENDVELSEDALQAVSGGCGMSKGDPVKGKVCPLCGGQLYFFSDLGEVLLYCNNTSCERYVCAKPDSNGYTRYVLWEDHGSYLHPYVIIDTIKRSSADGTPQG